MFLPDNLFYFLLIFGSSLLFGTFLLFSYRRNWLLILNSLAFGFCAIRATTEYYLPAVASYELATNIATVHSLLTYGMSFIMWWCTWFYLKPFQALTKEKEKLANIICVLCFMILPAIIILYGLGNRHIFYFLESKIDGYWRFKSHESTPLISFYFLHSYIFMTLVMVGLLVQNIIIDKQDRIKKIILGIFFILLAVIYAKFIDFSSTIDGSIPNVAGIYLLQLITVSWFVSGYRIFESALGDMTKDVLNSISDLAITTDKALNILNMNEQAKSVFHYQNITTLPNLLSSNSLLTLPTAIAHVTQLIDGKQENVIINTMSKQGNEQVLQLKVAALNKVNSQRGYTFLLSDLTKIHQKQQELVALNKTKDQLFSIIGHDLKRPALAFRSISKKINYLLERKEFDNLVKFCEGLEQSAFSLNNLLDNLLKWALSQQNALKSNPVEFEVAAPILNIIKLYRPLVENKHINLEVKLAVAPTVLLDLPSFMTICRNLLDNAYKFTPPGGSISIQTLVESKNFSLIIADTGIGMTSSKKQEVLEATYVNSTTGTANEVGSGLGLSLIKELATLNNGIIALESEVGVGTRFMITFLDCVQDAE